MAERGEGAAASRALRAEQPRVVVRARDRRRRRAGASKRDPDVPARGSSLPTAGAPTAPATTGSTHASGRDGRGDGGEAARSPTEAEDARPPRAAGRGPAPRATTAPRGGAERGIGDAARTRHSDPDGTRARGPAPIGSNIASGLDGHGAGARNGCSGRAPRAAPRSRRHARLRAAPSERTKCRVLRPDDAIGTGSDLPEPRFWRSLPRDRSASRIHAHVELLRDGRRSTDGRHSTPGSSSNPTIQYYWILRSLTIDSLK